MSSDEDNYWLDLPSSSWSDKRCIMLCSFLKQETSRFELCIFQSLFSIKLYVKFIVVIYTYTSVLYLSSLLISKKISLPHQNLLYICTVYMVTFWVLCMIMAGPVKKVLIVFQMLQVAWPLQSLQMEKYSVLCQTLSLPIILFSLDIMKLYWQSDSVIGKSR